MGQSRTPGADDTAARLFRISGRVQGVFFRASTRDVARELGLSGYAINLPDGRVEVLARGPVESLDRLAAWLAQGPRLATVTHVEQESVTVDPAVDHREGFTTG